jgi:hypothetical protein
MARANAGPRRVPCRRSRARHRPDRRASAGHQSAASLAPTLGAARTLEGPAAAAPIEGSVGAAAQRIQRDSAPHCSWSSSALCWAEEEGWILVGPRWGCCCRVPAGGQGRPRRTALAGPGPGGGHAAPPLQIMGRTTDPQFRIRHPSQNVSA